MTEVMINHIKEHRARLDLTQEQLAERITLMMILDSLRILAYDI